MACFTGDDGVEFRGDEFGSAVYATATRMFPEHVRLMVSSPAVSQFGVPVLLSPADAKALGHTLLDLAVKAARHLEDDDEQT